MKRQGFTILEIVIAVALLLTLMSIVSLVINPIAILKEGRDNTRIGDISTIERAIIEFRVDTGSYPDDPNTLRVSTIEPSLSTVSLDNATAGWIDENLANYTPRLPLDPLNDATYNYQYIHDGYSYELNATLEYLTEEMQNDGGNDPAKYEVGSMLNLISP